jgi:teichuronic acid biosynthesis glycosyltransferase TuaG
MENKQDIFFSVVCPAYNAGAYLHDALQSVIIQTFKDWELIIVDDGSTDDTAEIAKSYTSNSAVKYVWQSNGKQGKARNLGVNMAKGNWIAFLDADDEWMENKLEKQAEQIRTHVAGVYCSSALLCDEDLNVIGEKHAWNGIISGKRELLPSLLDGINPIIFNSVVINRELFQSMGGLNEKKGIAEDYELFLRLCDRDVTFYGSSDLLVKYRFHAGQTSHSEVSAFALCVNAFRTAEMKSVQQGMKNRLIRQRVSRFLVHHIDDLNSADAETVLSLYPYDGASVLRRLVAKVLLSNKLWLKKMAYNNKWFLN